MTVFGGQNGWGQKIAKTGKNIFEGIHIVDKDTSEESARDALRNSEIAFLAAPDDQIKNIIETHRERMGEMIIMDCATNKGDFKEVFRELSKKTSVVSTHPMVISTSVARGQNAILMPLNEQSEKADKIAETIYSALEMVIHRIPFWQHGNYMSLLQNLPHVMQRAALSVLDEELKLRQLDFNTLRAIAPANFLIAELAMGRVAMQRPDVSAGIIHEAAKRQGGAGTVRALERDLKRIRDLADTNKNVQAAHFEKTMESLDPDGSWRKEMQNKTNAILESLGNLKLKSFILIADKDRKGLLKDICAIVEKHQMNMTAIQSKRIEREEGETGIQFDVGIEGGDNKDLENLQKDMEALGLRFERVN